MPYTDQDFEQTAASHTPGPWWRDDDGFIAAGTSDNYVTVASPNCSAMDIDEREANARLIAAAPDMLGELKNITANAWQYDDDAEQVDGPWTISNETYQRIVALVAKATGREP